MYSLTNWKMTLIKLQMSDVKFLLNRDNKITWLRYFPWTKGVLLSNAFHVGRWCSSVRELVLPACKNSMPFLHIVPSLQCLQKAFGNYLNALEKAWEKIDLSITLKELLKYTQKDGGKEFFWTPLPLTADSLMQLLDEKSLSDSLETKCPPKHKGMVVFFSKF